MTDPKADLSRAVANYQQWGWPAPDVLLVSGSGLAVDLGEPIHEPRTLGDLLPFEAQSVIGHPHGIELVEPVPGRRVLYCRGRLHSYQGYDAHQVALVVRVAAALGAQVLLMTNASGGLSESFAPGQLNLVSDHINLLGMNPLRGQLPEEWGPQFPDMSAAYEPRLRDLIRGHAEAMELALPDAVYAAVAGPSYETAAEIRMLRAVGADLVGMSTVLEVIAANHMGLACACVSLVTNFGTGVAPGTLHHQEVLDEGKAAAARVRELFGRVLADPELVRR